MKITTIMAENSKISWTNHTVNFWQGCKKVSDGCKYCYMYRDKEWRGQDGSVVLKVSGKTVNKILKNAKPGDKIFTCSWSDFFIKEADEWRKDAWDVIRSRPDLIWQILTKRPGRISECLPNDWGEGWDNVWLGTSCENEATANERIPELSAIRCKTTFISAEPLLGGFNLAGICDQNSFVPDWVIIGGESGNDTGHFLYRKCHMAWITRLIDDCELMGSAVWVKQLGTYLSKELSLKNRHGADINEWPGGVQVQRFPGEQQKQDF